MGDDDDTFHSTIIWGPDGEPLKIVIPFEDLPQAKEWPAVHRAAVEESYEEGWPDGGTREEVVEEAGEELYEAHWAAEFEEVMGTEDNPKVMVALRVPQHIGERYGFDAAGAIDLEPLTNRHITLVYLGDGLDAGERERLHDVVREWIAQCEWQPLDGEAQGWGTFSHPDKDTNVLWMGWNIPGLAEMRHDLCECLKGRGFKPADDYDFTPHETIGYTPNIIKSLPEFPGYPVKHTFDAILVAEEDDWVEYPFQTKPLFASGRQAMIALLEESDVPTVDIGVTAAGFAVDTDLLGFNALIAAGDVLPLWSGGPLGLRGFHMFKVDADDDSVLLDDVSRAPLVVTAAGSRRTVLELPFTGLDRITAPRGGAYLTLTGEGRGTFNVGAGTSVGDVSRFIGSSGGAPVEVRLAGGDVLGTVELWSTRESDSLALVAVGVDAAPLRWAAMVHDGDWAAVFAKAKSGKGNAAQLKKYWLTGKGAAKIRWNTKGDWERCVKHLRKHMGPRAKGYCQNLHKLATGMYTGDMKHRIMYGWGGKPGSYWAKKAAKGVAASGEDITISSMDDSAVGADDLLMLLSQGARPQAFRIPLLLPEGIESGDGRTFEEGVVEVRGLPLPLLWQPNSMQGHDGAMIVGRIDSIERTEGGVGNATGVFDTSPIAQEAVRMIREGFLRGVSADLDKFEAKIISKGGDGGVGEAKEKSSSKKKADDADDDVIAPDRMSINKGRIMAATLVAKPAFEEARIELVGDMAESETPVLASAVDGNLRGRLEEQVRSEAVKYLRALQLRPASVDALVASAFPVVPPVAWFENPGLRKPTHLTITDDGRVYGHIAAWKVDHIGMGFGTKPPKSKSGYAYFRTGMLRTAEAVDVRVGQLTLTGGHASLSADARGAVRHYDDTKSAFADVVAGEDRHGIWVAGALRPDVTPEQLRAARASSPSGDWRPINGRLELVAVCQVNVPGFPVVEARVASGAVLALVAAGTAPLLMDMFSQVTGGPAPVTVNDGGRQEQYVVLAEQREQRELQSRAKVLRSRFELSRTRPVPARATADHVVEVAAELQTDHEFPKGMTIREAAAELFATREAESLKAEALTAAAKISMTAMPDGTFKITNAAELQTAIEEFGGCAPDSKRRVKNHIKRRALALGLPELLPSWWRESSTPATTAAVEAPVETTTAAGARADLSSLSPASADLSKQPVLTQRRREYAKKGWALPDGAFPIADTSDLKRAIHAYGRAKTSERAKVRKHIMKRARSLGHPELIPSNWSTRSAVAASAAPTAARARESSDKEDTPSR